jgi:flagellar hook-associated protein 2
MAIDTTKTSSASIVKTLELGSGVDIQALAKGLSEAESQPRIDAIRKKQDAVERSISGYGIVATAVDSLKRAFEDFKNKSSLSASSVSSSSTELKVSTGSSTLTNATHNLSVSTLARPQVSFLPVTSAISTSNLSSVQINNNAVSFAAGATPESLVTAINAAGLGVNASLVNRKDSVGGALVDSWGIVLQGQTGSSAAFSLTANGSAIAPTQSAQDARLTFNGMTVFRASNVVTDLVAGVTLDLRDAREDAHYTVQTVTDYRPLKEALRGLVSTYNEISGVLDELGNTESKTSEFSGALSRDKSLLSGLRTQLRELFSQESATASGAFKSLRNLGFSFALDGTLKLDETTLDAALASAPDDVARTLTAGLDNQTKWAPANVRGLVLQISLQLGDVLASSGTVPQRLSAAKTKVDDYATQLEALEERLQKSYEKYVAQFAAMESFVERSQGIGKYLEGQFKSMENMYD